MTRTNHRRTARSAEQRSGWSRFQFLTYVDYFAYGAKAAGIESEGVIQPPPPVRCSPRRVIADVDAAAGGSHRGNCRLPSDRGSSTPAETRHPAVQLSGNFQHRPIPD